MQLGQPYSGTELPNARLACADRRSSTITITKHIPRRGAHPSFQGSVLGAVLRLTFWIRGAPAARLARAERCRLQDASGGGPAAVGSVQWLLGRAPTSARRVRSDRLATAPRCAVVPAPLCAARAGKRQHPKRIPYNYGVGAAKEPVLKGGWRDVDGGVGGYASMSQPNSAAVARTSSAPGMPICS